MKLLLSGICAAALVAGGLATTTSAFAQTRDASLHAGELEVPVNKSKVVTSDRPIDTAAVGNPEIAQILPLTDRSIYVLGKSVGTTSLTLHDRNKRVIAVMDVSVGPDIDGLRKQLGELIPGQQIDARLSNGSVLLTGTVSEVGASVRAAQLAKSFAGEKVINMLALGGSQQVMLEVRFAEVSRQAGEQLGLRSSGVSNDGSFRGVLGDASSSPGRNASTLNSSPVLGAVSNAFGVLSQSFSIGSVNIDTTLDAMEKRGLSKTLAEPTLIALSGERASFLAGGEFPIPVAQSGSTAGGSAPISVEFKSFGVSLGFTPTVLADKVISLLVEPEVSSLDPSASVSVNGLVIPGLKTRRASTTVELRDGESFAIAGLLSRDFQTTVRQFPLLGSIPIIGALFRSSGFSKGETELLIVVTPHLAQPLKPGQVRLPTDRVADPKASDVLLDGEGYRPQPLPPQSGVKGAAPPSAAGAVTPGETEKPKDSRYEY